jgi:hypothetical protein
MRKRLGSWRSGGSRCEWLTTLEEGARSEKLVAIYLQLASCTDNLMRRNCNA